MKYKVLFQSLLRKLNDESSKMSDNNNDPAEVLKQILLQYHGLIQQNISKISETVDNNFNNLDKRLTSIEEKLNALSKDTSTSFKEVGGHLVSIRDELDKINKHTGYEEAISNLRYVAGGKS